MEPPELYQVHIIKAAPLPRYARPTTASELATSIQYNPGKVSPPAVTPHLINHCVESLDPPLPNAIVVNDR